MTDYFERYKKNGRACMCSLKRPPFLTEGELNLRPLIMGGDYLPMPVPCEQQATEHSLYCEAGGMTFDNLQRNGGRITVVVLRHPTDVTFPLHV